MKEMRKKEEEKMVIPIEKVNVQHLRSFLEKLHLRQYHWIWDIDGELLGNRPGERDSVQMIKERNQGGNTIIIHYIDTNISDRRQNLRKALNDNFDFG